MTSHDRARSSEFHCWRFCSSPGTVQRSLEGGSIFSVTPEMNGDPLSVSAPTDAPEEPCTWIFPYNPGRCELLRTTDPIPPFLKRTDAITVSSTSMPGWL